MPKPPSVTLSRRTATIVFIPVLLVIPVMSLLLLLPNTVQKGFCPRDVLVAGHLVGGGIVFGALGAALALIIAPILALKSLQEGKKGRAIATGVAGGAVLVIALTAWSGDLFNYYCAGRDDIVVHHAFRPKTQYSWDDVLKTRAACLPGSKGGLSIDLDVQLSDGSWIGLGGDSLSSLNKNFDAIRTRVRHAPYDNSLIEKCPTDWKNAFEKTAFLKP
jgi:hypothetical protein